MLAYKGFNRDMTCRGFQFKEGETYETSEAKLCKCGFHACEAPLDVLRYYPPATSEYHAVELEDVSEERKSDTKVCAKRIKIGAKLSIANLVDLQVEYVKARCINKINAGRENVATADKYGMATADDEGVATAGDHGVATAGEFGVATAGNVGAATAGDHGVATAGNVGAATAGYHGVATAGEFGVATAGEFGVATAGYVGAATAGYRGAASAGCRGAASAGEFGMATSKGSAFVGANGVALVRGNNVRAKGGLGSIIVIVEEMDDTCDIYEWKAGVIDGEVLKPDTWYRLENGEFVECDDK